MKVDHYHFPQIDSTNAWAKANAAHLNPERLTVITAGMQTAGRGRYSRAWISPPDVNMYASYCFFLPASRRDFGNIPQVVAVAAIQALASLGFSAGLKWPNDLQINGKKVGGLLGETTPVKDQTLAICGLGLNVNMTKEMLSQINTEATSLALEIGHPLDVIAVTESLERAICSALETFVGKGFAPFLPAFKECLIHRLGDTIRFHMGENVMEGSFHSINDDGTLNLILNDQLHKCTTGEIMS